MRRLTSSLKSLARILFVFAVVALACGEAHADPLELTIHDPIRNIPYNSLAVFNVTLTNTTGQTLFIGSPGFPQVDIRRLPPIVGGSLTIYNNALLPSSIAAMSSIGPQQIFTLGVTPEGTFNGLFIVFYYLPNEPGVIRTASANFSVTAGPTPEPATLLLLGTGMAGLIGLANRKRKSRVTD